MLASSEVLNLTLMQTPIKETSLYELSKYKESKSLTFCFVISLRQEKSPGNEVVRVQPSTRDLDG